jgi:Cdc6-like AAA superfamily ATPase
LFCPGIPGAGKTILASVVIDNLNAMFKNNENVGIAYIYCNFQERDTQSATALVRSLLMQLTRELSSLPDCVKQIYSQCGAKEKPPSLDDLSGVLQSLAAMYSRVFIIVDALDECRASEAGRFLSAIFSLQAKTGVNIFATSRPIPDIEREFKGYPSCKILANDEDVRKYLDGHMSKLRPFVLKRPNLQEEIKNEIAETVDGMYVSYS